MRIDFDPFDLLLLAALCLLPDGCGCKVGYFNDGTTGPDARPYYKVESCKGQKPRVVCDSPTPLPTETCR